MELTEIDFASNLDISTEDKMTLKKPNQVYYEIYKQARKKAKQAKKEAIMAFLEAKNIKKTYMLEDLDESDSDTSDMDNMEEFVE
jgi:rRNA-processing protein FCF1